MPFFSTILACIVAIITFVYFSEKSKSNTLKWSARLLPPFILLGLIKIPFDLVTVLIWLVAACVMVYSFCRLVYLLFVSVSSFFKKTERKKAPKFELFVRPLLCVLFFFTASHFVSKSVHSANAKALELALATQKYVQKNGTCSLDKPEWATPNQRNPENIEMQYGEYGTKYRLVYNCNLEYEKFSYWVRISQDEDFRIVGDFDGSIEITFGDYGAPKKVSLSENLDLGELVKMKIKYKNET